MSTETERQIQALLAEHIGAWSAQTRDDLTAKLAAREDNALHEIVRLRAVIARVEALAEEWDPDPGRPKRIVSWAVEAVRKCGRDIRAALAEPERDEEGGR